MEAARQQLGQLYASEGIGADEVAAFVIEEVAHGGFADVVGKNMVHDRSRSFSISTPQSASVSGSTSLSTPSISTSSSSSSPSPNDLPSPPVTPATPPTILLSPTEEESRKQLAKKVALHEKAGVVYVDANEHVFGGRKPIINESCNLLQPAILVYFDSSAEIITKSLIELVDRLLAPVSILIFLYIYI